jgi:hypothetical protein
MKTEMNDLFTDGPEGEAETSFIEGRFKRKI